MNLTMPLIQFRRCPTILGMTVILLSCATQTPKPEYGIREDEPRAGSSIRRYVVEGSPIPINRQYNELTAEEKASLNQYYVKMEPGDEPPFPIGGLRPIFDAIRKAQSKLLVSDELILVATVGADGEVVVVKAIGSPSPEMTKFAMSVLLLTKFKPALCHGQPCKMEFPFRYQFRVQ